MGEGHPGHGKAEGGLRFNPFIQAKRAANHQGNCTIATVLSCLYALCQLWRTDLLPLNAEGEEAGLLGDFA